MLISLTNNTMNTEEVSFLLSHVHKFYSIGMPGLVDFPGEKEFKAIVTQKITRLINKESTAWTALVAAIKKECSFQIKDFASRQFPSYMLEIILEEAEQNGIKVQKKLVLNISLLCPGYTLFFEDEYRLISYSNVSNTPMSTVLSFLQHPMAEKLERFIGHVRASVDENFPEHSFLPHDSLFSIEVRAGLPSSCFPPLVEDTFPIYTFLLDGFFTSLEHVHVLQ